MSRRFARPPLETVMDTRVKPARLSSRESGVSSNALKRYKVEKKMFR
jgi:hypothetical protein